MEIDLPLLINLTSCAPLWITWKSRGGLYCARHYACTRLANDRRLSIKGAMRITGHKTLSEFVKYLHVRDRELEAVAQGGYADFVDGDKPSVDDNKPP
jgi:hypothetical protein